MRSEVGREMAGASLMCAVISHVTDNPRDAESQTRLTLNAMRPPSRSSKRSQPSLIVRHHTASTSSLRSSTVHTSRAIVPGQSSHSRATRSSEARRSAARPSTSR